MAKSNKNRSYLLAFFIGFLILIGGVYIYFAKRTPILWGYHEFYFTPKKYRNTLYQLASERKQLNADNKNLNQAFVGQFRSLMPFWYGTRYSFYGQTHTPGEGKIACGYFVTTVLEDLGMSIDRNRLAQVASEEMIKELVSAKSISRFSAYTFEDFIDEIAVMKNGLYVVGLDTHTGFGHL